MLSENERGGAVSTNAGEVATREAALEAREARLRDLEAELESRRRALSAREETVASKTERETMVRFWDAILPALGVLPSRPGEVPGACWIETGSGEATVLVDMTTAPDNVAIDAEKKRIVALTIKLAHDYRRLGDHYYCIDCDIPTSETRH